MLSKTGEIGTKQLVLGLDSDLITFSEGRLGTLRMKRGVFKYMEGDESNR